MTLVDPHTGANGTVGGELLQSPDDLRGGCVGIMGLLAEQPVHPTGGVQPKGVPPLGAPALTGPAPLQDHMLDAAASQGGAGGQPGRSGPHHHTVQHHLARHAGRCLPVVVADQRGASAVLATWRSLLAGTMLQGNHTASTGVSGQAP
jgi:hypothetical protein